MRFTIVPQMKRTPTVQFELMKGREATAAIRAYPVGYLPIGCLERHGDHLPMGLDTIKAHQVCCASAKAIGGIVFPPHYYAGIHCKTDQELALMTGEWGNIYTDRSAQANLVDIIRQLARTGLRVLVVYSGHYPRCQVEMIQAVSREFASHPTLTVVPFAESMILEGDHAGISETSFMLHLDSNLVVLTQIREINFREHDWTEASSPVKASAAKGAQDVQAVIAYLQRQIEAALQSKIGTT